MSLVYLYTARLEMFAGSEASVFRHGRCCQLIIWANMCGYFQSKLGGGEVHAEIIMVSVSFCEPVTHLGTARETFSPSVVCVCLHACCVCVP